MKSLDMIITALMAGFLHVTTASNYRQLSPDIFSSIINARSLPDAPDGYTPTAEQCPENIPTLRQASGLSENETAWLSVRRPQTIQSMRTLFQKLNITGLDTNSYFDNHMSNMSQLPNIGLAFSGGGYRAMLNGAGVVAAFDDRSRANSSTSGTLGGLLQSSTYMAGLSGGSWLVGSLFVNNFTSVQTILDDNQNVSRSGSLWKFGNSIFQGPASNGIQLLNTANYYQTIVDQVQGKDNAGFDTTVTDYWGRALSFQLINATGGGPSFTFSSISEQDWYTGGQTPMPLIVADARGSGQYIVSTNSTIYEFNPWELGSWDPTTYAFAPMRYIGSNFSAGTINDSSQCVRGFDSASFVMGTSSSLFNSVILSINSSVASSAVLATYVDRALEGIGKDDEDIADYPNPFLGYNTDISTISTQSSLTLVDGGTDLQNIPLYPLIQPVRNVDVIFAVDSSADTNASSIAPNWPNGTSLVATYQRQFLPIGNGTVFPSIPDQETFVNLGLNSRPTFFGCDAENMTGPSPIIVYIPNAPYVFNSNISTFVDTYTDEVRNAVIQNGYNTATLGNGTLDAQWPTCVGCAILSRSLDRTGTAVPSVCQDCFKKYCWDGTRNSTYTNYDPTMKLDGVNIKSAGHRLSVGQSTVTLSFTLVVIGWIML